MKTCPHCGAALAQDARFCPRCMTSLTEKRVIPTPKYLPIRWLSVTAAVFVLCTAVWAAWRLRPRDDKPTVSTAVTSSTTAAASGTSAVSLTTTITTFATTTTTAATSTLHSSSSTSHTIAATSSTVATTTPTSSSATVSTTSTTKKSTSTTTQAPKKAYPEEWDTVYRSTTEDNLPIEEVTWKYKAAGERMHLSRIAYTGIPSNSHTSMETYWFDIPLRECIVITGFDAPTSNGIYRIPAAIDGKVVIGVDMRDEIDGACRFNDEKIAPTVKRIYMPPEVFVVRRDTINLCTALEAIYISSHTLWLEPEALPETRELYLYSELYCYMSCETWYERPLLKFYCEYIDYNDGYPPDYCGGYYEGAIWRPSSFAQDELYGPQL